MNNTAGRRTCPRNEHLAIRHNVESIIRIHRDQYKYSISARYRLVSIAGKLQSFGGPKITGNDGRFPLEVTTIAHRRLSRIRSDGPAHHNRDTEGTVQGVTRDTFVGLVPDDALPYICATYDPTSGSTPHETGAEIASVTQGRTSANLKNEIICAPSAGKGRWLHLRTGERKNRQLGMGQGAFCDPCVQHSANSQRHMCKELVLSVRSKPTALPVEGCGRNERRKRGRE